MEGDRGLILETVSPGYLKFEVKSGLIQMALSAKPDIHAHIILKPLVDLNVF